MGTNNEAGHPADERTIRRRGILVGGEKLGGGQLGRLITHQDLSFPGSKAAPFSGPGWIFELKYQGWRCLARHSAGLARLISVRGRDMSRVFPEVVKDIERLPAGTAIDGQLAILDAQGQHRSDQLRKRAALLKPSAITRASRERSAVLIAWDALMIGGRDLRDLPLLERKAALREVVDDLPRIDYAEHFVDEGEKVYADALGLGLEGVVAKRSDSRYAGGLMADWLTIETSRA